MAQWVEHWQLKPDVLGSWQHHFLFSPMSFQRSTDSNDAGCALSMRCQEVFGLSLLPSCLSSEVGLAAFMVKNFFLQPLASYLQPGKHHLNLL